MAWDRIIYDGSSSLYFLALDGTPRGRTTRLVELERDGYDGNAWLALDKKSKRFTLFGTVDVVGINAARTLETTTYPAIVGKLVQIDQNGILWPGYFACHDYEPMGSFALACAAGGLGGGTANWMVLSRWELQWSST